MSRTKRNLPYSNIGLRRPRHKNYYTKSEAALLELLEEGHKPRNRYRQYRVLVPNNWDDIPIINEIRFKIGNKLLNLK